MDNNKKCLDRLFTNEKPEVITQFALWQIIHNSGIIELKLKIGRYNKRVYKFKNYDKWLECDNPRSELTLEDNEFKSLLCFLRKNKKYFNVINTSQQTITIDTTNTIITPEKRKLIESVINSGLLPEDLELLNQQKKRQFSLIKFEKMLSISSNEQDWQEWFRSNSWVLGTDFVEVLNDRRIDNKHISDLLMRAYDGFVDVVEIKKPHGYSFWKSHKDHNNNIPSAELIKAITQATTYLYEIERESDSLKFYEANGRLYTIKPRCILIFGRSSDWDEHKNRDYRILNSNYHNLSILTYDHVLDRAKKIISKD